MSQSKINNPINAKRMLTNTGLLYIRHLFILFINLFTVRLVLNALGAEDFGIYNVVAGIVLMCSFFCGTMATSSQRYFSIDLGKQDYAHLSQTFTLTLFIFGLLAILFVLLADSIGLWFINHKLTIPPGRMFAANCIYQTSIVAFLFTLFVTPFLALIISHEDMNIYAYLSILEAVLKLILVLILGFCPDKLIAYGMLMTIIGIVRAGLYIYYCVRHYPEIHWHWLWNFDLFKEIIVFSGWNLFGAVATLIKNQGTNILLNIFYGPLLNAAQSLAGQVRTAISMFSNNFSHAMRPQISKSYAVRNYEGMFRLVYIGSKVAYFLMLVVLVPLFFNITYILGLWLKSPPTYTVVFVQLLMIESLIESLSQPMASVNQATGKIALYQFLIGSVVILNLPVAYWILVRGYPVAGVYVAACILMAGVDLIRLIFLKQVAGFSYWLFIKRVFMPICWVTLLSFIICKSFSLLRNTLFSLGLDVLSKMGITLLLIWMIGLTRQERRETIFLLKNYLREYWYAIRELAFGN